MQREVGEIKEEKRVMRRGKKETEKRHNFESKYNIYSYYFVFKAYRMLYVVFCYPT